MKTLLLSALICISLNGYSQTKKESFNLFKQSETRKELNIEISEFEQFYKSAKCLSKAYNIKLSEMPIFTIKKTTDFIDNGRYRQSLFGLGDTIFPEYNNKGKKTITCNAFATSL